MMVKPILATTVLWCVNAVVFPLHAQQQKEPTLSHLWDKVENQYPGLAVKQAEVAASKLEVKTAKSHALPQLKAQAQNTYSTYETAVGAFFAQPGLFSVNAAQTLLGESSTSFHSYGSATLEWEVFSFGKLHHQNKAAEALYQKSISEREAYVLQLKKTLSERYIALLFTDSKVQWAEQNVRRLRDIQVITASLSLAGLRPLADSLLASSSYVQAQGEYEKRLGYQEAARYKLEELTATPSFDYSESAQHFITPSPKPSVADQVLDPAHPVLEALSKETDFYQRSSAREKNSLFPSVNLLAGYAYRGTGIYSDGTVSQNWQDGFKNQANNYVVGIGITWDITRLYSGSLKGKSFSKKAERNQWLQAQYEQTMQADLAALQTKIRQQFKQLQNTQKGVQQAQDAYAMYFARYKSGLIPLNELLQIRLVVEQAENTHIQASHDYWVLLAYEAEITTDFDFLFTNL